MATKEEEDAIRKVRGYIQKELFPQERFAYFTSIDNVKESKKRRLATFLCVTVTLSAPISAKLHTVKKAEKGDGYKKKHTWDIGDIKSVDGKFDEESSVFEVQIDKLYKWKVKSADSRYDVIHALWKLTKRHLREQPKFKNIGDKIPAGETLRGLEGGQHGDADFEFDQIDLAYQVLSPKDEGSLSKLMDDCEIAITDAHQFTDKLNSDLLSIEAANIHSIVGSQKHVDQLMQLIDEAIDDAERIEEKLTAYDEVILVVKEEMERMKVKDDLMKVQERNHESLINTLSQLVKELDLSAADCKVLAGKDLSKLASVELCSTAALKLQNCLEVQIPPALMNMKAIRDQKLELKRISDNFSKRLTHHLSNLIVHEFGKDNIKVNTMSGMKLGDLTLKPHINRYQILGPYTRLMVWLKRADFRSFRELQSQYQQTMRKCFEREVKMYLEAIKYIITQNAVKQGAMGSNLGSSESLTIDRKNSATIMSANKEARLYFNQLIEKVLGELIPICQQEQNFCVSFFHLITDLDTSPEKLSVSTEIYEFLSDIFNFLDEQLLNLITHSINKDTFYSLSLLVHINHYCTECSDNKIFLTKILGTSLISAKRNFDEYIKWLCSLIEESKPSKKSRCGIIPFVHRFEEFAEQSENIFHNSSRRSDLDRAYRQLAAILFTNVARIASEHGKTPRHVIMLENFHRINAVLSRLKITCLDDEKRDARSRYREHENAYVQEQMGRPMEKLTLFFEGVDQMLKSGVKAEEVGYHLSFNKQELRKVIKEYPAKEIRKGLEALYKKVEKHLSEEENLLQVVWNSMQREFLNQYKLFEEMLRKCYKDSGDALEFNINDILQMFSEIAQLH